jgi:hypothetical protein
MTKMNWLLRRAGFYWPTIMVDCIKYQKGCEACDKKAKRQVLKYMSIDDDVY